MTSVTILNVTSRFHHGSAAAMKTFFETVEALSWTTLALGFGNTSQFDGNWWWIPARRTSVCLIGTASARPGFD